MLYGTLIGIAILLVSLYIWALRRNGRRLGGSPAPSPFALPIIGHYFLMLPVNLDLLTKFGEDLGGIYTLHIFHIRIAFLNSVAAIKDSMVAQSELFNDKEVPREGWIQEHGRYAILFLGGPVLREKRRFTLQHLRNFGFGKSIMEVVIVNEIKKMCLILDKQNGRRTSSLKSVCFATILNVLWGVVAGKTYEHDDERLDKISEAIHGVFKYGRINTLSGFIPGLKYIPGDPFNERKITDCLGALLALIQKEIDEHRTSLVDGEPRDYIDAYLMEINRRKGTELANGNECYTERHLLYGVSDIINAGIETTSSTIEWSLLYMAIWPEIQAKVQDELDTVIGINRRPTFSDMPMLPYVKATIMEIQRFSAVNTFCSPRKTAKSTTILNCTIPKGTLIIQNLYAVHRDKKIFGDPHVFRPERFLHDENSTTNAMDGVIPFTIGPRNCVGESLARMEVFLLFTCLMQRYKFRCITGEPLPSLEPMIGMTRVAHPYRLIIKLRSDYNQ